MIEIFYLIPIIFNFYTREFEVFPHLDIKKYTTQQECVLEMNKQNIKYEAEFSAIRMICQSKKND